jgi:hypothetical protein
MSKSRAFRWPRVPALGIHADTRDWLARVALSLAAALLAGALAFLVARAIGDVILFAQQQELLREVASAMRGGILGLADGNLHAVRLRMQQLDARNEQLSLLIGFAAAALAALASYLWLERRAEDRG